MSDENVFYFPNKKPQINPGTVPIEESGFTLDLDSDAYLDASKGHCKGGVLVLGYEEDDTIYITSNVESNEELLWLVEKFKKFLLCE